MTTDLPAPMRWRRPNEPTDRHHPWHGQRRLPGSGLMITNLMKNVRIPVKKIKSKSNRDKEGNLFRDIIIEWCHSSWHHIPEELFMTSSSYRGTGDSFDVGIAPKSKARKRGISANNTYNSDDCTKPRIVSFAPITRITLMTALNQVLCVSRQ